jgi:hypothetical protein
MRFAVLLRFYTDRSPMAWSRRSATEFAFYE